MNPFDFQIAVAFSQFINISDVSMLSPFEAGMLICFGVSWPFAIAKTMRAKRVEGKSPMFAIIVAIGYASGVLHKMFYKPDIIIWLYVLNFLMVSFDVCLYFYYLNKNKRNER